MTPGEVALKEQREERLRERQVQTTKPLRARVEAIDDAGRSIVNAIPAGAVALLIVTLFSHSVIAWLVAIAIFFHRWALYRGAAWIARTGFRAARNRFAMAQEAKRKAARAVEAESAAAARKAEEDLDSIDGVPMHTIASALATLKDAPLMHTFQGTLNFKKKKADDIRLILMSARFLVWPFTITDKGYALGDEAVAQLDPDNNNATMLHPTLRTVTADERAHVIEDALRRNKGITPLPELKIRGELSENGRKLYGRTFAPTA